LDHMGYLPFPAKLNKPYGLATTSGKVNETHQVVKQLTTTSGEVTKWIIWVTFHFQQSLTKFAKKLYGSTKLTA